MRLKGWKLAAVPVAALGLTAPMMVNCGGLPGIPGADCKGMETGDFASLKISGSGGAEIKGFLEAAYNLKKVTIDLEAGLIASCAELGGRIGVDEAELKAEPAGGKGAQKVCGAVAAKVSATLKASGSGSLSIEAQPPKCYADVEAMSECFGSCGAPIDPGKMEASCEGGKISGSCSGECSGECTMEAGADCTGTCEGSCSGSCEADFSGTCGGACDGKCDGKDTKGECKGKCEGKCDAKAEGTCGGSCSGKCSATCKASAKGECKGNCEGGCSGKIEAPKCSGEFKPPSVSVDCQAKCAAKGAASLKCDPPKVVIKAAGQANAEVDKLISALQISLPKMVAIQLGSAKAVASAAGAVVTSGQGLVKGAGSAGLEALGCVKAGIEASVGATASIDVNVKASASVSGSASGKAEGGT